MEALNPHAFSFFALFWGYTVLSICRLSISRYPKIEKTQKWVFSYLHYDQKHQKHPLDILRGQKNANCFMGCPKQRGTSSFHVSDAERTQMASKKCQKNISMSFKVFGVFFKNTNHIFIYRSWKSTKNCWTPCVFTSNLRHSFFS